MSKRTMRAVAVALAIACGAQAQAAAETVPPKPEDPSEAKVYGVFDALCARCHQQGKLDGLRPARGFGNILDLAAIARDETRVRPGLPDASAVYTIMQSRTGPHEFSNDDLAGPDLDAVRGWIAGLPRQPATCSARTPTDRAADTEAIAKAVADAGPAGAKTLRFLSLAPLHNQCRTTDNDLKAFADAIGFMVNSLSWGLDPVEITSIDAARTIFKVDLAKIGWDAARWELLTTGYPYAALAPVTSEIVSATETATPVVRADWFLAKAGRAPLYYDLLGLPDRLTTLTSNLKVESNVAASQSRARRIGVKTSKVARGSRLLQRSPFANGAMWTAFEYAPTPGRPDLFEAPGGPGARGAPRPDASVTIFSLPSGFDAFFMANADGIRLNEMPTSILHDDGQAGGRINVGTGCLVCHGNGAVAATDEIRARVQTDPSVPRDIRERVLALHGTADENARLFDEDAKRQARAVVAAGIALTPTAGGGDAMSALASAYERPLTLAEVATELGIATEKLRPAAAGAKGGVTDLLQRLLHGPVPRRDVEGEFAALAALVATDAARPNVAPAAPDAARTTERNRPFELVLKTATSGLKPGDLLALEARSSEACYLTLINIDGAGRGTVIFPNDFEQNNLLEPGKDVRVPSMNAPYQFRLRDKGLETVVGICQQGQKVPAGIRHDFERQRFTELGDYRAFLNRTANAEMDERKGRASGDNRKAPGRLQRRGRNIVVVPGETAAGRGDPQARTAIEITIE